MLTELAAFSNGSQGGNPAGVWIGDRLPPEPEMQALALKLGHSETVFAARQGTGWRVRYFAPEQEVPFCGHATIALGAALGAREGAGRFALVLNSGRVTVEAAPEGPLWRAAFTAPPAHHAPYPNAAPALALFGLSAQDLSGPPLRIHAGADHLWLPLARRETLAAMRYDLAAGRALMRAEGLTTIALTHGTPPRMAIRNAFASGGVLEDPATGAAAAALAGALRDLGLLPGGRLDLEQGDDIGIPCRLTAIAAQGSVTVSGLVRAL